MTQIQFTAEGIGTSYGGASDALLLEWFIARHDQDAFATLVERYRQLVMRICRRALTNHHDVEDAAQDTFIALASGAAGIENPGSLASWLYGVATRTARRLAAKRGKRREQTLELEPLASNDEWAVASHYMHQLLDEELDRLPQKYRDPLILHYLMGKTTKEVAEQLGASIGQIDGCLKRGKRDLRVRFAMRGAGVAVSLGAVHAVQGALRELDR